MIFEETSQPPSPARAAIRAAYLADETACVEALLEQVAAYSYPHIKKLAEELALKIREHGQAAGVLEALLSEYDLSTEEGVVLMCLSEALLRIPDSETADRLIHDKLAHADWEQHLGHTSSLLVNAATWGLLLTGRIVSLDESRTGDAGTFLGRLVARSSEPMIRLALKEGMRIMGHQFVMGRTLEEAIERSHSAGQRDYRYSFDMLGEAAMTEADAEHYFQAYLGAITTLAEAAAGHDDVFSAPGVSVKLSALHPRFEFAQRGRVISELAPKVLALAQAARTAGISLTLDAEEAERLEPTLDVFEAVYRDSSLAGWEGLGIAVQAYQKRAVPVLDWLAELAQTGGRRIMLRLVKGAYWDTEIKRAQERGLASYPLFSRKVASDVCYQVCAQKIFAAGEAFYPQFATHNAYTVATVLELAGLRTDFEFQRLHGMGEALYDHVTHEDGISCRVYAPVGSHKELLPYLVRRLLENGANNSFVNRIGDDAVALETLLADPITTLRELTPKANPRIPLPAALYGEARRNAAGINLHDADELEALAAELNTAAGQDWQAAPLIGGKVVTGTARELINPARHSEVIGTVVEATAEDVTRALELAAQAVHGWAALTADERAAVLVQTAELLEQRRSELLALIIREGGRTLPDAVAELREAVDFCRYYAQCARQTFGAPLVLPGPTGERNELSWHGRGIFVCISPWNFPLAIFIGQIAAALAAGNAVLAKPASQTPLVAMLAVKLLHQAGVPIDVLHLLPGSGGTIGEPLLSDPRVAGVAFTGSTETAHHINRLLAGRGGPIVPLIAETGGQNAMIADSSALPEQVVRDVLASAFNSAGQRCSALRVLFLQQEIAERTLEMLRGAMAQLRIGDPALLSTDVGPVIDGRARDQLQQHLARMRTLAIDTYQVTLPDNLPPGWFVAPTVFEIDNIALLEREVFGPMLHVIRYEARHLDQVIASINSTGYGLTLGIHTRIEGTADYIHRQVQAGNAYVNRNMIGAVVGAQPFGGEGLSGTGPKAGGPHYLQRFAKERTYTVNTAAVGGNTTLLAMGDHSDE